MNTEFEVSMIHNYGKLLVKYFKMGLRTNEIKKSEYEDVADTLDIYMGIIDKTMWVEQWK